jgi:2'-5' RNA ligase
MVSMPCATTLYFDLETDAAVRRLWQAVEDAGLPSTMLNLGFRPHLTLAVCESLDLDAFRLELPAMMAALQPIPLTFSSLGTFIQAEGVVYLGVTVTQALLDLHSQIWHLSQAHMDGISHYYVPGIWVPHITLGYDLLLEQVGQVMNTLLKAPLPVSGMANELVITDDSLNGFVDLYAARLGRPLEE